MCISKKTKTILVALKMSTDHRKYNIFNWTNYNRKIIYLLTIKKMLCEKLKKKKLYQNYDETRDIHSNIALRLKEFSSGKADLNSGG